MMPPLKAIRQYCLWCCTNQPKEVRLCTCGQRMISNQGNVTEPCALYPYRFGHRPNEQSLDGWQGGKPLPPLRAIRTKCLDCAPELAHRGKCGFTDCSLYPYHMGHNPKLKGKGPEKPPFLKKNSSPRADFSTIFPGKG